jgi:hypothetical protein
MMDGRDNGDKVEVGELSLITSLTHCPYPLNSLSPSNQACIPLL